ncbi:MAG: TonB-dependent receptor [Sphingomonadaceae bacterium]
MREKYKPMGRRQIILSAAFSGAAVMAAPGASAREATVQEATAETASRKVYEPAFFEQFAPRTALDMLVQVPGFAIRDNDQGRGLGQADDNVLVNGERLAIKSDSLTNQIGRISADRVVRIEIVDGGALDIPGLSGQVANIVTTSGELTGSFEWRSRVRAHYAYPQFMAGEVTVNGSSGKLDYTITLRNGDGRGAAGGIEYVTAGDGSLIETRDGVLKIREDYPRLTTSVKWDGPGDSVGNFSAMYRQGYYYQRESEDRLPVAGAPYERLFTNRWRGKDYEINADYEFALGPGRLKVIALEQYQRGRSRSTSWLDLTDGSPRSGDRFTRWTDEGERILRGEYSWKMLGGDWQFAAEGAFNRLKQVSRLGELQDTGDFALDYFPEGSGGVTEDRYEAILTYGRPITSKLSFKLGAGGEYSKLSQTGANGLVREFWRPKGSLTLAWAASKRLDISAKLEREVGQLSFGDFLGRVFLDDGNANAANARLVPPQSWEAEIEAKLDLAKWGSTSLRFYADRVRDYIDLIPNADFTGEFRGNIPRSSEHGVQWTGTFNLDPLGFKGAKIESDIRVETTAIRDPVTGRKRSRSWNDNEDIEVFLRHDVPGTDWAWSLGYERYRQAPYNRLREVGSENEGPYIYGFVEHKDVLGTTVRLSVFNLNNGRRKLNRTIYDGPRDRAEVLRVEEADQLVGPIFTLTVKGNF